MKVTQIFRNLRVTIAYVWAFATPLAVFALFLGWHQWSYLFSQLPFMRVHPRYTGGEIMESFTREGVTYHFHQPVVDGLIGDRKRGFIQVDVVFQQDRKSVDEIFDWDWDGVDDFRLQMDDDGEPSQGVVCQTYTPKLGGVKAAAATEKGWIVRIEYWNF